MMEFLTVLAIYLVASFLLMYPLFRIAMRKRKDAEREAKERK